ncbi:hypothetical protein NGM37_55035 [Streptomyces sp. TRM76130]|nr:hypothetical protein [Streptomyces sp. TRM76130]
MEHVSHPARLAGAADAAGQPGTGHLLQIVLVVMVVGCVLTAWFLLRGHKSKDD